MEKGLTATGWGLHEGAVGKSSLWVEVGKRKSSAISIVGGVHERTKERLWSIRGT